MRFSSLRVRLFRMPPSIQSIAGRPPVRTYNLLKIAIRGSLDTLTWCHRNGVSFGIHDDYWCIDFASIWIGLTQNLSPL